MDAASRIDTPLQADEVTTLRAFLDYHRDTLRWKVAGLTQEQLAQTRAPSSLTLGGLVKHLALVESNWFEVVLGRGPIMPPFDTVDWEDDPDWEFHTAAADAPEQLLALFDDAVARADRAIDAGLAKAGLETAVERTNRAGEPQQFSLRWIMLHMIEEYARHNGHADLLRESIDGQTGE